MDIGIFSSPRTVDGLVAAARSAADDGFGSYWTSQIFSVDALTGIAVAAKEVEGIRFGTGVVPIQPRHPMMLAGQALTVSQVSGGRLDLGIGLSHQMVVEGMWGLPFDKPVRQMREYLEALGPLLAGENPQYGGETITARGGLDVPADPPPVLVAALGPQMLTVTGRLADGTVTWMTGPKTLTDLTVPTIQAAAEGAGRPAPRVVVALPVCVTDDEAGARERAAAEFAVYGMLPSYRAMLDREGMEGPADLAFVGSADAVASRIAEVDTAGATTLVAAEFGLDDEKAATRELLKTLNG
ncbi:MAG TPA: TIGR03564 family F420-dependent LLM class oxidoreductase [Acidimicrobiales bacterium]